MQHEWAKEECMLRYWCESQKERDQWEDQNVGGWIILKLILER
jgi:hypothetical protein